MASFVKYFNVAVLGAIAAASFLVWLGVISLPAREGGPVRSANAVPQTAPDIQATASGSREIGFAPMPGFVEPVDPVAPGEAQFPAYQGARFLLIDSQYDATGPVPVSYGRYVVEASNSMGVNAASAFHIPFAPDFQRLTVHSVQVVRGGVREDRGSRFETHLLRQEPDLAMGILTGIETALIRIEDVRAGDVVDIAWSISGDNPALGGGRTAGVNLRHFVDVERVAARFTWPAGEARAYSLAGAPDVRRQRRGRREIFVVPPQPAPAVEAETGTPAGVAQIPTVIMTSYEDWGEVADWARPFYAETGNSAQLSEIAADIRRRHDDQPSRAAAAIRFVQDEIRYFAVALGEAGLVPAPVEETLRTRTGDCKAKTLLLIALLDQLGIESHAALTSVMAGHWLDDKPTSPAFFDHVLLHMRLGQDTFWIDPTLSYQRGGLYHRYQPDYGYALVLDENSRALVAMEPARSGTLAYLDVMDSLDLRGGPENPGLLEFSHTFRGPLADEWRAALDTLSEEEIENHFVDLYDRRFRSAELIAPLAIEDTQATNTLSVRGRARVGPVFRSSRSDDREILKLRAHALSALLYATDTDRTYPVAVDYPVHTRHDIEVNLPALWQDWPMNGLETLEIDNPAFTFRRGGHYEQSLLRLSFEQQSKRVAVALTSRIADDHEEMTDSFNYSIWYEPDE